MIQNRHLSVILMCPLTNASQTRTPCFIKCFMAWSAPNHYLNQCWNSVNGILRNILQWNVNLDENLLIAEVNFKIASAKLRPFLSAQCVKMCRFNVFRGNQSSHNAYILHNSIYMGLPGFWNVYNILLAGNNYQGNGQTFHKAKNINYLNVLFLHFSFVSSQYSKGRRIKAV